MDQFAQAAGSVEQTDSGLHPAIVEVLVNIANDLKRIADRFDPPAMRDRGYAVPCPATWGHDDQDCPDGPQRRHPQSLHRIRQRQWAALEISSPQIGRMAGKAVTVGLPGCVYVYTAELFSRCANGT